MTVAEFIEILKTLPQHACVHRPGRWSNELIVVTHEVAQYDTERVLVFSDGRVTASLEEKLPFG